MDDRAAPLSADAEVQPKRIVLKAIGNTEIHFELKITTTLGIQKAAYAERVGVSINQLCFMSGNRIVNDASSPDSLGLASGEIIKVLDKIRLEITSPDNNKEVLVLMKYGAPMCSLIKCYSTCVGIPIRSLCFVHKAVRIDENATPASLRLADGDLIKGMEEIDLRIVCHGHDEARFRVKYVACFTSVKKAYAEHVGINVNDTRFAYNGVPIDDGDSSYSLKLQCYDVIHATMVKKTT